MSFLAQRYSCGSSALNTLLALVVLFSAIFAVAALFTGQARGVYIDEIVKSGLPSIPSKGGVSWGDYDSDGFLDLLVRGGGKLGYRLYHNEPNGTFADVTESAALTSVRHSAVSATFGDYDNDGCPDIYIANGENVAPGGEADQLFHSNCNGTFSDVSKQAGITVRARSMGVTWGDYDNDGYLDIYVATYGEPQFDKTDTEWKVTGWVVEPVILYHNNRDGTFTDVAARAHVSGEARCSSYKQGGPEKVTVGTKANWQATWLDYDNDGLPDLYTGTERLANALYHNNVDGTFTDVTEKAGLCIVHSTHGTAVGDYDNDGYLDIYVGSGHRNLLWRNNGDGTFTESATSTGTDNFDSLGWGVGALDFDNDGLLDLYAVSGWTTNATFANAYPNRSDRLYKNTGGTFTDVAGQSGISGTDTRSAAAFGDYNNDGFTDVFVRADEGFPQPSANRLYQAVPNGNHYLTVKLIGTKSNRDGVGARITVEIGGKKQIREVISGGSFLSQNSLWQTFGLGTSTTVDTLTIRWPSGIVQSLHTTKAGQLLTVREENL